LDENIENIGVYEFFKVGIPAAKRGNVEIAKYNKSTTNRL
jgi:hypothetical protein